MKQFHRPRQPLPLIKSVLFLASLAGLFLTGCQVLGVAAQALPEANIPARYSDLKGHSVAALAWVPRGLEIDFPSLRLDLVSAIQSQLQRAGASGPKELQGATFPHTAASLVRFQQDHPELERTPIATVAPRLGVQRLIYIEVENFQTRSEQAVDLFRGSATVSLRVVEVDGTRAKIGYEESGLTVTYPPTSPPEGMPGVGDAKIYRGTVDLLASVISKRFYAHPTGK